MLNTAFWFCLQATIELIQFSNELSTLKCCHALVVRFQGKNLLDMTRLCLQLLFMGSIWLQQQGEVDMWYGRKKLRAAMVSLLVLTSWISLLNYIRMFESFRELV